MKDFLKKIPIFGWFSRWIYNLLRLNNLKHTVFAQQQQINMLISQQNQQQAQQQQQIKELFQENNQHRENYNNIKETIEAATKVSVSKQINAQAILLHQRLDQFIANQKNISQTELENLKKESSDFLLDNYYLAFEDTFRGSREFIMLRYHEYLKYLNPDIKTALDIGCGRAEWVELLQSNGIDAQGIDLNSVMLHVGQSKGVKNLHHKDAFEFLATCKENSFDLVSAFHIIEHVPYEKLIELLLEIKRVAAPNATILLETPNPANLIVASNEFYKDPTHLNPLPADVVKFLVEYLGFSDVKVEYLHPFAQTQYIHEATQTAQILNHYLYQAQDYLIVAKTQK